MQISGSAASPPVTFSPCFTKLQVWRTYGTGGRIGDRRGAVQVLSLKKANGRREAQAHGTGWNNCKELVRQALGKERAKEGSSVCIGMGVIAGKEGSLGGEPMAGASSSGGQAKAGWAGVWRIGFSRGGASKVGKQQEKRRKRGGRRWEGWSRRRSRCGQERTQGKESTREGKARMAGKPSHENCDMPAKQSGIAHVLGGTYLCYVEGWGGTKGQSSEEGTTGLRGGRKERGHSLGVQ